MILLFVEIFQSNNILKFQTEAFHDISLTLDDFSGTRLTLNFQNHLVFLPIHPDHLSLLTEYTEACGRNRSEAKSENPFFRGKCVLCKWHMWHEYSSWRHTQVASTILTKCLYCDVIDELILVKVSQLYNSGRSTRFKMEGKKSLNGVELCSKGISELCLLVSEGKDAEFVS